MQLLINLQQSFSTINLFRQKAKKSESANSIADQAREICRRAEEEFKFGAAAQGAMQTICDEQARRNVSAIACWHHERAAEKFREAAALFGRVKNYRVSRKAKEHFNRKAAEMNSSFAKSKAAEAACR